MTGVRFRSGAPIALLLAATVAVSWSSHQIGDYVSIVSNDNPRPSIQALAHGHVAAASHVLPLMGLFSLLLRAPFAALGGSDIWLAYRLGALICLLPLTALAVVLDRRAERAGADIRSRVLLGAALIAGPGVLLSVRWAHPEQVLMGTLCVAAVMAAMEQRVVWAGVLLGLALGTKQDALVAAVPVLLTVGGPGVVTRERVVVTLWAGGLALLFNAPVALLDLHHYREMAHALARTTRSYPQSFWWPFDDKILHRLSSGPGPALTFLQVRPPLGMTRGEATSVVIPLALSTLLLPAVRRRTVEPLALLAGLLALRAAVDPANLSYYMAGAMVALVAWEATRAPGQLPLVSVAMTVITSVVWYRTTSLGDTGQFLVWLASILPFFALSLLPVGRVTTAREPRRRRSVVHDHAVSSLDSQG